MAPYANILYTTASLEIRKKDTYVWVPCSPPCRTDVQSKLVIRNLSPHLRNSAILRTTKSIAELRIKKCCRTVIADLKKFDFRNSATLCSLLPIPLLFGTFSSAQDGFKNQPNIFLELSVSLETKNLGQLHNIFYLQFFFMNPDRILRLKIWQKLRKWSSQVAGLMLQTSEKIAIAELRSCGCGAKFL